MYLGLEKPGAAALRALTRLRQFVLGEREAALLAFCRLDDHLMPCGASRPNGMAHVIFDVAAVESHLARDR